MATFAFSGGSLEVKDYGQRNKMRFGGVWVAGDSWTARMTSTLSGNFTLGKGNIAGKTITSIFKFKNRAILGYEGGFALSAIDDPTGWEEQDIGSANIPFTTQYGFGDSVYGFSTISSKFAIFGAKTTQIWTVDADPTKWVLSQVLDHTGTKHGDGIQAIGEIDVLYPDKTGIRSLHSKELSGDAFVSDVGVPIDSIIRAKIKLAEAAGYKICSVVEPITKNYWVFIYDTIYVLTQSPTSKITAWASFEPYYQPLVSILQGISSITGLTAGVRYHWEKGTGAMSLVNGTETLLKEGTFVAQGTSVTITGATGSSTVWKTDNSFRPIKMFDVEGVVYILGSDKKLYSYDNTVFDWCLAYVETPWIKIGKDSTINQFEALDIAAVGSWKVSAATNPKTNNFTHVLQVDVSTSPTVLNSSTYDFARYSFGGNGTRIKFRLECDDQGGSSNTVQSKFSALNLVYKSGNTK